MRWAKPAVQAIEEKTMSQLSQTPNRPSSLNRRAMLGGISSVAVLSIAGCATCPAFTLEDAVRRLLFLSTDRAFARLLQPGGFWDSQVARLALPEVIGNRGGIMQRILTGPIFRDRLQRAFNDMAYEAADRAAPAVTDAVRTIGIRNAVALLRSSDPMAATSFLHQEMGTSLVEIMVPEFGDALRVSREPLVGEVLSALTGVDVGGIANSLAFEADNAIFRAIGREEAAIRADPGATNDPVLMGAFGIK
jgi:hypothetical protein